MDDMQDPSWDGFQNQTPEGTQNQQIEFSSGMVSSRQSIQAQNPALFSTPAYNPYDPYCFTGSDNSGLYENSPATLHNSPSNIPNVYENDLTDLQHSPHTPNTHAAFTYNAPQPQPGTTDLFLENLTADWSTEVWRQVCPEAYQDQAQQQYQSPQPQFISPMNTSGSYGFHSPSGAIMSPSPLANRGNQSQSSTSQLSQAQTAQNGAGSPRSNYAHHGALAGATRLPSQTTPNQSPLIQRQQALQRQAMHASWAPNPRSQTPHIPADSPQNGLHSGPRVYQPPTYQHQQGATVQATQRPASGAPKAQSTLRVANSPSAAPRPRRVHHQGQVYQQGTPEQATQHRANEVVYAHDTPTPGARAVYQHSMMQQQGAQAQAAKRAINRAQAPPDIFARGPIPLNLGTQHDLATVPQLQSTEEFERQANINAKANTNIRIPLAVVNKVQAALQPVRHQVPCPKPQPGRVQNTNTGNVVTPGKLALPGNAQNTKLCTVSAQNPMTPSVSRNIQTTGNPVHRSIQHPIVSAMNRNTQNSAAHGANRNHTSGTPGVNRNAQAPRMPPTPSSLDSGIRPIVPPFNATGLTDQRVILPCLASCCCLVVTRHLILS
jgi:hypothetical protein